MASVGLLLLVLHGAIAPVHALLTVPRASVPEATLGGADTTAVSSAPGHDTAECPFCRELARSHAATLSAPPAVADLARALEPLPAARALATTPKRPDAGAGPRAPPLSVVAPTV